MVVPVVVVGAGVTTADLRESEVFAISCGEASVRILCEVYGLDFPREKVMAVLTPGARGETSLAQINKCLRSLGFRCHIARGSVAALSRWQGPLVVHLKASASDQVGHFCVMVPCPQGSGAAAYDPIRSPKPMFVDSDTLEQHWTGYAILVGPAPKSGRIWVYASVLGVLFVLGAVSATLPSARVLGKRLVSGRAIYRRRQLWYVICYFPLCFSAMGFSQSAASVPDGRTASAAGRIREVALVPGQVIELGVVHHDEHTLRLVGVWINDTGREVNIQNVVPQCGCMGVEYPRGRIAAATRVAFKATFDVQTREGYFGSGFSVLLEGHEQQPMHFVVEMFKPVPPTPRPARIDVGKFTSVCRVLRQFTVTAVIDATEGECDFPKTVECEDDRVDCRFIREERHVFREPNTQRDSLRRMAVYEIALTPGEQREDLDTQVCLSVRYNGRTTSVRIPVLGAYRLECEALPSRIVAFLTTDGIAGPSGGSGPFRVAIRRVTELGDLLCFQYVCTDTRVAVDFTRRECETDGYVGDLDVRLRSSVHESFDANIDVVARFEDRTVQLTVPVQVRIVRTHRLER